MIRVSFHCTAVLCLESYMRFRSVVLLLCSVFIIWVSPASAQKKIFATVSPNAAVFNSSADIYDPATGKITAAGVMTVAREEQAAIVTFNGKVLIAGGRNDHYLNSMEIYNPADGSFTATTDGNGKTLNLSTYRSSPGVAVLKGGNVLIAGGYNGDYLSSAELYSPSGKSLAAAGSMNTPRLHPAMVGLNDGAVFVAGGFNGTFLSSVEAYIPTASAFSPLASMTAAREGHTVTLLSDGRVLITGGCNNAVADRVVCDNYLDSAEIWNQATNAFTVTAGKMTAARAEHTATLLPDGRVLIAGGKNATSVLSSAEIFDPATGLFTPTGNLGAARKGQTATALGDGRILLAGGYSNAPLSSAEIYSLGAFTTVPTPMSAARYRHTAVVLNNGKVLLAGGENSDSLTFDFNYLTSADNVAPNIVFSQDSKVGYVAYTGSGVVLAFSVETGAVLGTAVTGGNPTFITPLSDGHTLAVVSALDNKIFRVGMDVIVGTKSLPLLPTYSFTGEFGFGSILTLSPNGSVGYVSSTATGEVIKFNMSTGTELARLKNLKAPAQITATKDGNTLLVVDTLANELVFADAGTMSAKFKMQPTTIYPTASFTIFNKAVLNSDESYGLIGSQDSDGSTNNAAFIFKVSTGEISNIDLIGNRPGSATLLPDGSAWIVLCQDGLYYIPASNFAGQIQMPIYTGTPHLSANVVVSPDSKYAYYTSSSTDLVFQQDLALKAIIGVVRLDDSANASSNQASTVALTPDGMTLAVLNFGSNELDLLSDTTVLKQTKFISQQDKFTGLSIVNLSNSPVAVKVSALDNSGNILSTSSTSGTIPNPYPLQFAANEQKSFDVSLLFNFDNNAENGGRLEIDTEKPVIAAYSAVGQIHPDFLSSYTSGLQGFAFNPDHHKQLHDFIIPEIPVTSGTAMELNLVNPTYSTSYYDAVHYGTDGSVMQSSTNNSLSAASRVAKAAADFVTATASGRLLLIGGYRGTTTLSSSELYQANYFTASGLMSKPRRGQSSTLLLNEKVLIAGGKNNATIYKTAELYDPVAGTFSMAPGTMISARYRHTATLLLDGRVLIAGGQDSRSISNTAEIFDSETGGFTFAGAMISPRDGHTATRLSSSGDVLLTGGIDGLSISATAEIYDLTSSSFRATTGRMAFSRLYHTAVLLSNGKVLIAGGFDGSRYLNSAEIYDPATGLFSATPPMNVERSGHTSTLLSDGTVLLTGGMNSSGALNSAEIFDPALGRFLPVSSVMSNARVWQTATLIPNDLHINEVVLIAGGTDGTSVFGSAEFFDPQTQLFADVAGSMQDPRQNHTAVVLSGGDQGYLRVKSTIGLLSTEIYDNGGADASLNGIDMEKYAGVTKIYSPQFNIASNYNSLINIINGNQSSVAHVTLTLYSPSGTALQAPVEWTVPKNGQVKGNLWSIFKSDPALLNQTGWLQVTSSVDSIVGTISFTNSDNKFLASFELSGSPLSHFVFPLVSDDSIYRTDIALLNAGDLPANVRIELWDLSGALVAFTPSPIPVPAHSRIYNEVSNLIPGMGAYRTANVRITSDQPIHSFAILSDRQSRFVSAVPPVPYPGQ
jgi:hypothetical protein